MSFAPIQPSEMQEATSMEGDPRSLTVIPSIHPSVQQEPHVVFDNPVTAPSGAIQEASNDQLVTNLIINYLPPELNEDELMAIFAEHGEIEHIKVVRDHQTRLSLGYGFVKYKKAEEAQRAVKMKNGFAVGTKRIKVSFSRLPREGMKRSKLFVTNLPLGFDEDCIRGLLGKYGEIVDCNALRDGATQALKGSAYVIFAKKTEAEAALSALRKGVGVPEGCTRGGIFVKFVDENQRIPTPYTPLAPHQGPTNNFDEGWAGLPRGPAEVPVGRRLGIPLFISPFQRTEQEQQHQLQKQEQHHLMQQVSLLQYQQEQQQLHQHQYTHYNHKQESLRLQERLHTQQQNQHIQIQLQQRQQQKLLEQQESQQQKLHEQHQQQLQQQQNEDRKLRRQMRLQEEKEEKEKDEKEKEKKKLQEEAYDRVGLSASITLSFANLPPHANLAFLKELVAPYGDVLTAHIDIDPAAVIAAAAAAAAAANSPGAPQARPQGLCAGRGFVQIRGMGQAHSAVLGLNGRVFSGSEGALEVTLTGRE